MAFSFGAPAASTSTQPQQAGTSTGFSFGNPSSSSSTAPAQPNTSSTFSFGQSNNQQNQQQPQQAGQSTTTGGGGFSFGQSQPAQQSQPSCTTGGFSFGQPPQSQNSLSKPGGFSFGNSLGASQNQPAQQQQQQQQPQTAGLGQSQLGQSQFGSSQLGQSKPAEQQQQQQDKRLGNSLSQKIDAVRLAWDTNNLQTCRFMTYFYNNLPPGVMPPAGPAGAGGGGPFDSNPNFGRRQDAVGPLHDTLWEKAKRENPDQTRLVPVLAVGFSDLKIRLDGQEAETERQASHLKTINERITALEQKHSLSDSVRASAALKRQAALHHRVMGIARKSHLLVPSLRNSGVTKEEEALRSRLEACEAELESGGSASIAAAGRMRARVNELWALLGSVKAKREMLERQGRKPGVEWAVVDEQAIEEVTNILGQQQQGLNHVISTLEEDSKALDTVLQGLKGVQLVGVKGNHANSAAPR